MSAIQQTLNPYIQLYTNHNGAESECKKHARKKACYQTASLGSLGLFSIASIAGVVATGVCYPIYLPFALIGSASLLPFFKANVYDPFKEKADFAKEKLDLASHVLEKLVIMQPFSEMRMKEELSHIGIRAKSIRHLDALKSHSLGLQALKGPLAHYQVWKTRIKLYEDKISTCQKQALKKRKKMERNPSISEQKRVKIEGKIVNYRLRAYKIQEEDLLPAKLKCAFMRYSMSDITAQKTILDFGTITPLPYHERNLLREYDNKNPYFRIARKGKKSLEIDRKYLLKASPSQIAKKIFFPGWVS